MSRKTDKVAELAEESCTEVIDKEFSKTLTFSAQDLVARKVAQELNVECVTCDAYQSSKVGSITAGKLERIKYNFMVSVSPKV